MRCLLPDDTKGLKGRIPDVNLRNIQHLRQRFPAAKISVEVEKPGRPGLPEMAAEADVVFYSKSWAQVGYLPTYLSRLCRF